MGRPPRGRTAARLRGFRWAGQGWGACDSEERGARGLRLVQADSELTVRVAETERGACDVRWRTGAQRVGGVRPSSVWIG